MKFNEANLGGSISRLRQTPFDHRCECQRKRIGFHPTQTSIVDANHHSSFDIPSIGVFSRPRLSCHCSDAIHVVFEALPTPPSTWTRGTSNLRTFHPQFHNGFTTRAWSTSIRVFGFQSSFVSLSRSRLPFLLVPIEPGLDRVRTRTRPDREGRWRRCAPPCRRSACASAHLWDAEAPVGGVVRT